MMKSIKRVFTKPMFCVGKRELIYCTHAQTGEHIVMTKIPEQGSPILEYFPTIDEARVCWKRVQDSWLASGYVVQE